MRERNLREKFRIHGIRLGSGLEEASQRVDFVGFSSRRESFEIRRKRPQAAGVEEVEDLSTLGLFQY